MSSDDVKPIKARVHVSKMPFTEAMNGVQQTTISLSNRSIDVFVAGLAD